MKRTPLRRRTALKRSTTPLKRSPIRKRSKRMAALYAGTGGRRAFVAEQLALRPYCEAKTEVCTGLSVDIHEPRQRSKQGSILDVDNSMSVCRLCHGWIHEHPRVSGENGWLINKWTPDKIKGAAESPTAPQSTGETTSNESP